MKCSNCNYSGESHLKLGGLICGKCRIILYYPNSIEYDSAFKYGTKIINSKLWKLLRK